MLSPLFAGLLASPPGILLTLLVVVLVLVVGRVVLALAWRVVVIALGVALALWVLGAIGLSPL